VWSTPAHVHDLSDEEHFTAEHALRYFLEGRGLTVEEIGVNPTVVATLLPQTWRSLAAKAAAQPAKQWLYSHERIPLSHGLARDVPVSLVALPQGAPAAVMVMEFLIALGARRFLVLGAAGSLQERAPIGSFVVPEAVVREDGTSFHYQPPEVTPTPASALATLLRERSAAAGVAPVSGVNWSTDAIFRELKRKVLYFRKQGVLSVEMEAAALFAAGAFRGVEVAMLLVISDELFRPWAPAFLHETYRGRLKLAQDVLLDAASQADNTGHV